MTSFPKAAPPMAIQPPPREATDRDPAFIHLVETISLTDAISLASRMRRHAPTALRYIEPILAEQGDAADPDLIALQHVLAEALRLPANN